MPTRFNGALLIGCLMASAALAQEAAPDAAGPPPGPRQALASDASASPDEALHDELRRLRDQLVAAINAGDMDQVLEHLHPNIVYTPQNNEVCRGHAGVRAYLDKMMTGPDRVVQSFSTTPAVDELTIMYGGGSTGVAFGGSVDRFTLTNGMDFTLHSRWTATLVREDGRWTITAFHISANLFDNPLLEMAKATVWRAAIGALLAGLILGLILARFWPRRRRGNA